MSAWGGRLRDLWHEVVPLPDLRGPGEWCEEHVAKIPYSPVPGPLRLAHAPWMREIMAAYARPTVRQIVTIGPVQASKTLTHEAALCWLICNAPGPALWLDQTDDDARDQAESRLQKLFDECAPVRALMPSGRYERKTGTIQFQNGMTLWVRGASNKTNLQRRSIRWLIGDETWRWPRGHMAEAEARVTAFGWLGKCVWSSQGSEEGDDTHAKWLASDQARWHMRCPACAGLFVPEFKQIEWDKAARLPSGEWDLPRVRASARLVCPACGAQHDDRNEVRAAMNAGGEFGARVPGGSPGIAGFTWNALASMSWGALAEEYLRARAGMKRGDLENMRAFRQKRLAEFWREEFADFKIEVTGGAYARGQAWERTHAINGVPIVTVGVDVQMDHFYAVARAWAADGSSRLIDCAGHERELATWDDLAAFAQRVGAHPSLVFIDTGHRAGEVVTACARHGWNGVRGDQRTEFLHRHPRTGARFMRPYSPRVMAEVSGHRAPSYVFSTLRMKDTLAALMRNQDPQAGATWELPGDIPEEYGKQMAAERKIHRPGGWRWEVRGAQRANHYFDCEVICALAATMCKLVGREGSKVPEPGASPAVETAPG